MINIDLIKKLREETGAGVVEAKQVLERLNSDYEQAKKELLEKAGAKAAKKQEREAGDGLVFSYIHAGGKVGSLVQVACETDFVAKTEEFQKLCREIAMQVATDEYKNIEEVLNSEYIRDPGKKISDLIAEATAKTGEKIELKNFCRFSVN